MRKSLFATAVLFGLLAACNQGADDDATGNTAANSAPVLPVTDNQSVPSVATASLPTQALSGEQAKAAMKARHDNYEDIGDAMKVISRELKGDSPDLAAVRQNADIIATLAPQVPSWFAPGTGPEAGKTEAKAEIWQKPEDFSAKATAFSQAATAFQATARGNDVAAIKAAHGNLGKSCKACHDLYREKDD